MCSYSFHTDAPLLQLLQVDPGKVLIESTGVIGQRIKKVTTKLGGCLHFCLLYVIQDLEFRESLLESSGPFFQAGDISYPLLSYSKVVIMKSFCRLTRRMPFSTHYQN